MRRILIASLVGVLVTASSALAADENGGAATVVPAVTAAATSLAQRTDLTASINLAQRPQRARRPLALPSLYATSALLQGYDAYSTLTVLNHGGTEANPLMTSITKSPVVFIGLKAGATVMSIMAAERMWKDHNRVGAVLTMVASNGFMAMVAKHNASVMARVK
jgi:hypothetical protein